MLGLRDRPKSSKRLDPVPLDCFTPGLISEGCGTGRAYVVYLAKEREIGLVTFDHCASLSCHLSSKDGGLEFGCVHDLRHSSEWKALSPSRSVNLGLSAPNATTWGDIHHFKIPFGRSVVSVFATGFTNAKYDGSSHVDALAHCVEDLRAQHKELDRMAREIEDAVGGF